MLCSLSPVTSQCHPTVIMWSPWSPGHSRSAHLPICQIQRKSFYGSFEKEEGLAEQQEAERRLVPNSFPYSHNVQFTVLKLRCAQHLRQQSKFSATELSPGPAIERSRQVQAWWLKLNSGSLHRRREMIDSHNVLSSSHVYYGVHVHTCTNIHTHTYTKLTFTYTENFCFF